MESLTVTSTTTDLPTVFAATSEFFPANKPGYWEGDVSDAAWSDIELPDDSAWKESVEGRPFDLGLLWEVLEKHKEHMDEKEAAGKHINTTWELVVIQGVLLTILVLVSVSWAFCCKKKCFNRQARDPSVAEALRKLSENSAKVKDLPPSYSRMDLHTLGISVNDYLNPPPQYLELFSDNLQYLDLEQGHNRLAKLSFCSEDGSVPRGARLSVASCENCSSESPVVVPVRSERSSVSSASSSSSRRQSRNSRVSFSEEVACSNGSIRRLSSNSLISLGAYSNSSRKSSSSSDGSRKSSLISKVQRKMGSNNTDTFANNLDEELQQKLASIGEDQPSEGAEQTNKQPVTAETQAERAARICDIIVEEK